jgi:tetratricopeptide (TPR) repeat protein
MGFAIVISYLIFRISGTTIKKSFILKKGQKSIVIILAFLLIIPYSLKTIKRNQNWKDHITLLGNDIKYLERSAKANYIYAGVLKTEAMAGIQRSGDNKKYVDMLEQAITHFQAAVDVYPEYYEALNQLGSLQFTLYKDHENAIKNLNKAIRIKPDYPPPYFNLGYIHSRIGELDLSVEYYNKMLELKPDHLQSVIDLQNIFYMKEDTVKADYYSKRARQIQYLNAMQ